MAISRGKKCDTVQKFPIHYTQDNNPINFKRKRRFYATTNFNHIILDPNTTYLIIKTLG